MIESMTIKGVTSYDNDSGASINELKRLNFFFGKNGSGKSSIGNFLYSLSNGNSYGNCAQSGFDHQNNKILVFNEDFISRNFIQRSEQRGVFSLNEKNEEIDKQIKSLEKQLDKNAKYLNLLQSRLDKVNLDQEQKNKGIKNKCFTKREQLKAFKKFDLKHPGSKDNHYAKIKSNLSVLPNTIQTYDKLLQEYQVLYEKDLIKIDNRIDPKVYKKIRTLEKEINQILEEIIVGNEAVGIAGLIKGLGIKKWVEEGVSYIQVGSTTCPFCQSETIEQDLLEQFNSYFDDRYKSRIEKIKELGNSYHLAKSEFLSIIQSIKNQFDDNGKVSVLESSLDQNFSQSIQSIGEKIKSSNEIKSISSIKKWKSKLSELNKEIDSNNELFDNLSDKKIQLEKDIWNYLASECEKDIIQFDNRVVKYSKVQELAEELKLRTNESSSTIKKQITELREKTVSTSDAVNSINRILRNSGFDGFEIVERSDKHNNISQYFLRRKSGESDHVFKSLSEGEKNFISFLYFYQMCLGTDSIEGSSLSKIVAIDDPVSSLDSQVLFIVNTLIHQLIERNPSNQQAFRIGGIDQVLILTHNIYFYKEISLNKRPICKSRKHFQIIKSNTSSINEVAENDLSFDDYSLLWRSLRELKGNTPANGETYNVLLANNMRRILESYIHFNGMSSNVWKSIGSMDKESAEYILCSAFLSSINDSSHKVSPLDDFYYQRIVSETSTKLFDAFKLIFENIGKDHYHLMMKE